MLLTQSPYVAGGGGFDTSTSTSGSVFGSDTEVVTPGNKSVQVLGFITSEEVTRTFGSGVKLTLPGNKVSQVFLGACHSPWWGVKESNLIYLIYSKK